MYRLGPFELQNRLGQGGMGEVWRGVHRAQHTPVAVKLLTGALARQSAFRGAFRNEVRAVAGLDHPWIVQVYDYGTVHEDMAASLWKTGTPWLAMELADGGSLEDHPAPASWEPVRARLVALLDALAHAHARGVIHRDIKPANLLIAGDGSLRLTDFGLAHALDRGGDFLAGTPAYMAPEQFEGRWRDYGPWTDLYAVGCVVWGWCTGRPPFGHLSDWATGHAAHVTAPLPLWKPHFPVPDGLETWVRRALEKDPRRRWRRAADAARAWSSLPEGAGDTRATGPASAPLRSASSATLVPLAATDPGRGARRGCPPFSVTVDPIGAVTPDGGILPVVVPLPRGETPPPPGTWRKSDTGHRTARVFGAGLGLFGLRHIPIVGRRAERDALWSALLQVHERAAPCVVLLEGEEGCGKTRLAAWISERAHETGAATVLAGACGGFGERAGVAAMLHRALRTSGLDGESTRARLAATLAAVGQGDPTAWEEAADCLGEMPESGARSRDRAAARARLVAALSVERPVVVAIDDAHLDAEALDLAREVLALAAPVLVVLTLATGPYTGRQAARIAALRGHPQTRAVALGPLHEAQRSELVRQILGLEPDLAHEVERRSGGDPAYMVDLVGDWVQRDLLEPGRKGFRLKPGAPLDGLEDRRRMWSERLRDALAGQPAAAWRAVELLAVLGGETEPTEWASIVEQTGLRVGGDLVERLLARRVARCGEAGPQAGWRLAHGALRDVVEADLQAAGRHASVCGAAADLLRHLGRDPERRGRLLVAAGRHGEATQPLLAAVDERLARGDWAVANVLNAERDRALDLAEGAEVERTEGFVRWGRLADALGRLADAQAWADRTIAAARGRWSGILVDALLLSARVGRAKGDWLAAWRAAEEASLLAERDPTGWRRGLAALERGRWHLARGALDRATPALQGARAALDEAGDPRGAAEALLELARVAAARGRWGPAGVLAEWARARLARAGCRGAAARAVVLQCTILRLKGAEAGDDLEEALDELRAVGGADVAPAELELARWAAGRRSWALARTLAEGALRAWTAQGALPAAARAHALLVEVGLETGDRRSVDRHLARLEPTLASFGAADPETARDVSAVLSALESRDPARAQRIRDRLAGRASAA